MGTAFHFGYVEEHLYVFRETFTGNGAATTFQLTGSIGNATFETGSWTVVNVETAMAADASKTTGAALYDSLLPLVRHKITVSSISATGLVTLNYAPMAENFYIWYWYDMEGDAIQDYYRDDYVSSMEADAGVTVASGITVDTAAFAGQLSVADDTVQKAMDTLDDHYHSNIFDVLREPTGFANRTGSALAFVDGTLTLTVTVVSGSYTYWINAVPYVISGTKTLPIADTEGTHVIYFDTDSALHEYVNPTAAQYLTVMTSKAMVATIYWDATNKQSVFFGEERHGCVMDGYTHEYLHYTRGLQYVSGMDLADFTIGDGSLDAHAQFSISAGSVADEDIGLTTGEKATATGLPILYRSGATGVWRKVTQTGFVCYQNPLGTTNRLMWNENTGATWQLTEVTESDFVIYHIFATTGYSQQLVSIPGQAKYATLAAARTGATTEMNALLLGDLPALEMRPVASIIFQTDKDYGNTINARVVEVQSGGDDYVDWRSTDLPRGTAAFDSSLYVRVDGSAPLSANWDAGSFKITAETFASDVATGTAPLTIASATLVTNLNVDQVDSLHAQTLTATSPITLSGVTSVLAAAGITIAHAATAGNVHVPTAGATGQILIYGGASGTAAWTTATYPATTTAYRLLVSTAANAVGELAAGGSAGQYLRGATGAIPAWSTLTLPDTATAFKLAAYTATNVMTELVAVGATGEYLAGATGAIPAWATLNQAAVSGLTTASSPVFVTVKLSGLTDGYVPYHVADATGLANSSITVVGTTIGIESGHFDVGVINTTTGYLSLYGPLTGKPGGTIYYFLSGDYDDVIDTYNMYAYEDDFYIASNTGTIGVILKAEGDLQIIGGTLSCSDLTDGYVPYHVSDAVGLANSIISVTANDATVAGDLKVSATKKIYLDGGGDTYIHEVSADLVEFFVGAVEMITIIEGAQDEVRINEDGGDVDFTVEASGVADALIVLGANGQITLGALGAGLVYSDASGVLANKTLGIANANIPPIDDAGVADNEYAKFTANGLEGRAYADVLSDIGAAASAHNHDTVYVTKALFDVHTVIYATADDTPLALTVDEQRLVGRLTGGNISAVVIGIADNNIVQIDQADAADNDFAKFTANGLEGRSYSEVLSDIGAEPALGNPGVTGYVLSSTDAGVRSWIAPGAGASNPLNVGTDDDVPGVINIYGGGNTEAGGTLNFYTPNDQDGDNEFFSIGVLANTNDLVIGFEDDPDFILLDAVNKIVYLTDGSLYCQYGGANRFILSASVANGQIYCGSSLTAKGSMVLYGAPTGSNSGGTIQLETSFDNTAAGWASYYIQVQTDRLEIGRSGDLDAVVIDKTSNLRVTDGSFYCADLTAEVTYGDFGSSVVSRGVVNMYGGPTGVGGGGSLRAWMSYDYSHDGAGGGYTSHYWQFQAQNDDLWIGSDADTDALVLDNSFDLYLTNGDMHIQVTGTTKIDLDATSATIFVGVDDTTRGMLKMYGDAANAGGEIWLYSGATGDTDISYWRITNSSGAFYVLSDSSVYAVSASTAGAVTLAYTDGHVAIGQNDVTQGILSIYSDATTEGGAIYYYVAADSDTTISYYAIQANTDDLWIGPATDTDALILTNSKDLYLTDGDLNLQISGTTCISLVSNASYGAINVGVNDLRYGYIGLYGAATGSAQGGVIDFYTAADHDTSIGYYRIYANGDDLNIGPNTEMNAIEYSNGKVLTLVSGSISLTAGSMYAKTNYGANRAASSYVNFYSTTNGAGTSYYPIVSYKSDATSLCFYVRDDGYGYIYDTAWHYGACSETLKENIRDLKAETPDIRAVMRGIVPKRFDYKESVKETNRLNKVGYIAEHLELVIPGIIDYNTTVPGHPEPHMTFDRDLIIPYMVLGIHDVMDETDRLNLITDGLKAQIAALEEELKKLKEGAEL